MNVLVLCDDLWHPAEVIELGLAALNAPELHFTVVKTAKDILTPEYIARFPVILCCKSDSVNAANQAPWFEEGVTEVGPAEFEAYIQNGGGFLAVHSGNVSKEGSAYSRLVGNYFVGHPPRCQVEVKMTAPHPIAEGVGDFSIRDEHYNIQVVDEDAEIFCETESATGGTQTGGYTKKIGDGTLCVLTPGHTLSVWENKAFQRLLLNAIHYCAREV